MKKYLSIILLVALVGCNSKQPSTSTVTNTYVTNPATSGSSSSTSTSSTTGATSPAGCDGVARGTATTCYYKNIPTVQVSGGVPGQTYWSSVNLPTSISQNQFVTDGTFNVRIIARTALASVLSSSGKICSPFMVGNSKKLKVQLMLRKQGVGLGEVQTLTSSNDTPSAVAHFTPPGGTTQPYILEVTSVLSDTRCTWAGGSNNLYCPYADIPINTLGPTECEAFDIQFSTDNTYDLPQ
jgi:hypothetical protein